jgi:hypothetical protein
MKFASDRFPNNMPVMAQRIDAYLALVMSTHITIENE